MNSKSKHSPQRTCIACRKVSDKRTLIRLVVGANGRVDIDISGKKQGRGAYLCRRKACWELAVKKNRLDYALRTKLRDDDRQALKDYSQNLEEN